MRGGHEPCTDRDWMRLTVLLLATGVVGGVLARPADGGAPHHTTTVVMLTGDVMLGRGIDQILRHSVNPVIYEPYMGSAKDYVTLAEEKSGPIPRMVAPQYIWGDAL